MPSKADIRRRLIPQYREMVESGDGCIGMSLFKWRNVIRNLIITHHASSILDYGCGQAGAYEDGHILKRWGRPRVRLYDPAVPKHAKRPEKQFDGVICSDVLEHVPEDELDDFIRDVFGFARKFVFFSVCCRPAKRLLPDGQNAHVTVHDMDWWRERIGRIAPGGLPWTLVEND